VHHRIILVHMNLLDDRSSLTVEFVCIHLGSKDHIVDDIDTQLKMTLIHLHVVAGVIFPCEGIEVRADRIKRARNMLRGWSAACTFEHHVFNKMTGPANLRILVPRSNTHKRKHRNGHGAFYRSQNHTHSIIESILLHRTIRLRF